MANKYSTTESALNQHKAHVRQKLVKMIGNVTQLNEDEIEPQTHFLELGLDSITLSQVRHSIKDAFGFDIPMNEFFDTLTTLELLTNHVAERVVIPIESTNQKVVESSVEIPGNGIEHTAPYVLQTYEKQNLSMSAPVGLERILEQQLHLMSHQLEVLRDHTIAHVNTTTVYHHHPEEDSAKIVQAVKDSVSDLRKGAFLPDLSSNGSGPGLEKQALAVSMPPETGTWGAQETVIALTPDQKQLWFATVSERNDSQSLHETALLRFCGPLQPEAFTEAVHTIVNRHEALRTFMNDDGETQVITSEMKISVPLHDFSDYSPDEQEQHVRNWLAKDSTIPFPLIPYKPLFRVQLLKISVIEHIGVFTFHHLIADGWSMGVFMRELEHIYSALVRNEAVTLPDPVSFRNYAVWQHDQLRSGGEEAVTFWSAVLKRSLPVLDLPSPVRGLQMPSSQGSRHTLILEAPLVQRLRNVSIKLGNSLFITLLSAFQLFLHRLTGQKEVMVSVPTAGQAQMDVFSLIGNCVNMLPVISEVCSDVSFNSFAQTVKHQMNELEAYQKYSFAGLAPLGLKYLPVMNVVFNMDRPIPRFYFHQLDVEVLENEISFSKYELFLNVTEIQKQLRLDFDYNTDIFQENIVKTWSEYFLHLLHLIVENEEIRVSSISLLDVVGQERLRATWTDYVDSNGIYPCVLDAYKQPAPVGTAGEVYQASAVSGILGTTREWAYVEGGAKLLHIGHLDRNICIRGHQVNLEQLEKHLLQTFQLSDCFITPQTNEAGEVLHLTAFLVAAASKPWEESELKQAVNRLLPDYTRPRWCIKMDRIPLLANGEPDLQVLLEVGKASVNAAKDVGSEVQTAEEKLTTIWKDVLNVSEVNRHESFFHLGGDSLKATVILSKVNKELGVHIPLSRIFDLQTIAELSAFIVGGQQQTYESIVPVPPEPFYPVSSAQKRMYALDQLGGGTAYHISGQLLIEGDLEVSKFIEATREVILRHESFRTYFELQAGEIVQKIRDTMTFEIPFSRILQEEAAQARISFIRPFYLDKAPLLRIKLFELIQGGFMLLVDMHHIIADGFSMTIMMDEIIQRYQGRELADIQLHYKDFVAWKQQQINGSKWNEYRPYWLGALNGKLPVLQMPTDFSRPQTQSFEGDSLTITLDGKLTKSLYQLAQNTESTLFMVLLAAYNVLLAKYSGQEDIIVGSPVAGREHVDTQAMIGMFVNTLALRNYPHSTLTFQSFLQEVKQSTLLALEHQEYPFDELVDQLELVRDVSRNPVFDTMFSLQNVGMDTLEVEGVRFKPEEYNAGVAQVDFSLLVTEEQDQVTLVWEYATKLFKPETIRKLAEHYIKILETITQDSRLRLADMNILSDNEEQLILSRLNEMSTLNTLAKSRHIDYSDYKDHDAALNYWRAYLKEYEGQSRLPQARMNKTWSRQTEYHDFHLDADMIGGLQRIAQEYEVTIQILVQTVWGLLLQKYNGTDDVVFGSVALESTSVVRNEEQALDLQIKTVPVRIRTSHNSRFLEEIKQQQMLSMLNLAHKVYSLEEIEAMSEQNHDLINHILIFDHVSVEEDIQQMGGSDENRFCIDEIDWMKQTNYDFNLVVVPGKTIQMRAIYNALVFDHEHMEQIQGHLLQLLKQVVLNPDILVNELDIVTEQEREQILGVWGNTAVEYPSEQTIQGLFEAQVLQTPEQVALFFEGEQLTYRELNERANQLARTLRSYGVQPEQRIGLLVERSIEMIVGILAVLKAGGAYVPIDPEYPAERIHYMLEDFDAQIVLTQRAFTERISFKGTTLELDDSRIYFADGSNLMMSTDRVDHLIYVLYTSGTTGQPKGVMVNHRSAINTVSWFSERYAISGGLDMILTAEYTFDPSIEQIFGTLLHGGKLHCIRRTTLLSKQLLTEYIKTHNIRILDIPPALMRAFLSEDSKIPCLDTLICGGERLEDSLKEKIVSKGYILNNHYGPTETTIDVLASVCEPEIAVNLGKPIHNTRAYILNEHGKLQPIGVIGELCISGVGVARGYLNRPELTVEKFVPNPFAGGEANYERMYRTGDLARWLPDGNIEYLGRVDHQVKIRGYRIELGEVETNLMKVADVQEVVVLVHEDNQGQNQLVAYYVAEQDVDAGKLRSLLAKELPNYMVPAYFVQLEHIPLTSNGKIDRKSLPAPEGSLQSGADYAEPRTEAERTLVAVWESVLGAPKVGILDNFFDLGGDSIKAIQISSRLFQAGYKLEVKDMFRYPTVVALAPHMCEAVHIADQGEVSGETALLPIQQWFFSQELECPEHFNQAVMLHRTEGFDERIVRQAMDWIVEHHDALRTVFRKHPSGYTAWTRRVEEGSLYTLEIADLRGESAATDLLEAKATEIQSSINLSEGPLVKLGLFRTNEGDHLLIAIHHLVIDGVSWRILFEDFSTGYEQALKGVPVRLPFKTDSFQTWAHELSTYANSSAAESDETYWQQLEQAQGGATPLPKDFSYTGSLNADSEVLTLEWTEAETQQLLKQVHRAYNTEINDLLLSALGLAIHNWTGTNCVLVHLEGHGREAIIPEVDITRTVGWFTSLYPVLLEIDGDFTLGERIKSTKEGLRAIPHKGLTYGTWRYLSEASAETRNRPYFTEPEISFNYLGQLDQEDLQNSGITLSSYGIGKTDAAQSRLLHTLDLNAMISEGTLRLTIAYSNKQYRKETMEHVAGLLQSALQEVISHCVAKERPELTTSDVSFKGLTIGVLDQLVEQVAQTGELENVYALTPMQKGMLFHNLMDSQSSAYFEQVSFDLNGHFHTASFASSLDLLVQRHMSLRTNFYSGVTDEPLQIVYRNKRTELYVEDLRELEEDEQGRHILDFTRKDKLRGFKLDQDVLIRVAILRTGEETYRLIWSFHHIVMDGWCMSLLTNEVFTSYFAILALDQPKQTPVTPYSQYIEWLEQQDHEEAAQYWSTYLSGYEEQSRLPQAKVLGNGYQPEQLDFDLGENLTAALQRVAKRYQVTVNTLVQTVWGILLQKYNGTNDVVFGSVVSGRPADIPNVEHIIGLFINTIPVRINSSGGSRFLDVIKQIQEQSIASRAYDTYPLYEIQALTEFKQDLIDHIIIFENYPVGEQIEQLGNGEQASFTITGVESVEQTNYDFNLKVLPGKTIQMSFGYNALAFDRASVKQIQGHLVQLLEQVVTNPNIQIDELDIVTAQEREQILRVWGNTAMEFPREQTVHDLFEVQALQTPEKVALYFEGEQLTYRELNERANSLARVLQTQGVGPDKLVGLMVKRSAEMMIGLLAVLKAGGAYVPIDPEYPSARIEYVLGDSGATVLLTSRDLVEGHSYRANTYFVEDEELYQGETTNLEVTAQPDHLAYVIYTSGSTGNPKGVMLQHRSVLNFITGMHGVLDITADKTILSLTTISFDIFVLETILPLLSGMTVIIGDRRHQTDPQELGELIVTHQIDMLQMTPSRLQMLLDHDEGAHALQGVQEVLVGGEAIPPKLLNGLQSINGLRIYNMYGPTETTVYSTTQELTTANRIDIGRPIANTQIYIINTQGRLQPVGIPGELCIGGKGLARGYWNREDLTAEKFVNNPFSPGTRMYRTGDLARWNPDGSLEFIGRIDHQVKVRGFRIELGEVESQILKMEDVQKAVVLAHEDKQGENQLVAYYVAEREVSSSELRSLLAKELPNYMVPTYFVQLEHIPLTPNGKIDRKALPAPEGKLQDGIEHIAPRTWVESKLAMIWKEILDLAQVSVKDNFFEIGGHSLRATTLVSKIHKEMNKSLPLRSIFEAPTIEQLAEVMDGLDQLAYASIPVAEERTFYPLSSAQKRMYVLQQLESNNVNYNMPAVLQVSGPLNVERVEEVFCQLIERHASLRTRFEMVGNEPVQFIEDGVSFEVEYAKIRVEGDPRDVAFAQAVNQKVQERIQAFVRSFNLETAPLLRVALLDLGEHGTKQEAQHFLMLDMHHIISDGVSAGVLTDEFVRLYSGEELSPLRIQYKDYAVWQQNEAQQAWIKRQEAYWLDTFDGELPVLNLATDFTRPEVRSTAGATVEFELDGKVSQRLKELAAQTGSTLYMVLLAAYTALLHQYTGQEDIIVGSPIAGRPHADLEPVIGMFVGTLAMRNYPTAGQTFRSYVENVKKHALKAYEHQDYPFEELVDKLMMKRDMSRNPLFDTMFVLQNTEQNELKLADLSFRPYGMEQAPAKFDLTLEASEGEAGIRFGLEYATSLYQRETVEQMTRHFVRLVETVVVNPDLTLGELEWVTTEETVPVLKEHQERQKALRYWSNYLAGYEEQAHLPQAKKQNQTTYQAEYVNLDLGMELTAGIRKIAEQEEVSVSTLLQTAWGILLQRYNGTEDVVFGSVHLGRTADMANTEAVTGAFINTMPVRIQGGENSLFTELMKQNEKLLKYACVHATYPPHEIQGLTELIQDWINHSVIFADVLVEEEVEHMSDGKECDLRLWTAKIAKSTTDDFNLAVLPGKTIQMSFSYNALVFDRASVEQIQGHLVQLLEQVVAKPDIRVRELDIVTEQEREQILAIWGDTAAEYAHEQTIHGLFEAQVLQTPEQIALYFEGEQLTYRELNKRANQLARTLRSYGVQSDQRIGLLVERSIEMIVGILAVLKAGGAYVPIDPTYPQERIQYMLEDSGTKLLLTQSHLVEKGMFEGQVLILNGETSIYHKDGSNLDSVSGSNNLAYVIYTSGTTGQPKGVMLEHRGLSNLKTYFDQTLQIISSDHVLLFASYSFDASCWEIFQGLFSGATLYVATQETILNYERFEKYMSEHRITVATLPPTYTVYLEPARMPDLRILVTAGSAASIELVLKWKEKVAYYNAYGPTENSVATSVWSVSEDPRAEDLITIGRPIPNHRVYMVDAHGRLAPVGVPGELCVSGPGLARGYLDRPELTAEKFVKNPFSSGEASYERMYRTGDLARWMPDGNIEYLGRIDHQVKIRGYRIELGEVEAQILKMEAVQEVIVLANAEEQRPHQLVAYYVAEREVSVSELRNTLLKKLPNYMVPSYLMQLQYMPLTPNGKIDRKALPLPRGTGSWNEEYVVPRNALEQQLVELWQTVLGAEKVGIDNNFFELGGQSLKAILLVSKAQEKGIYLGIHQVLQHQTIRGLSDLLQAERCDTHHNTSWISSILEAEQWISNTFDVQALLQFVTVDEQDYLFLQVHPFRADQVDKIVAFIPSHVHPDLHPHYIVPMGGEDAGQSIEALLTMITITDDEQENVLHSQSMEFISIIDEMNATRNGSLLSSEAIGQFPLAPAQHYHLQHPASSGTVIHLNHYVDKQRLSTAVQQLMRRHELLRSVLIQSDGGWAWEVRSIPENLSLPMVDLSAYPIPTQRKLLSSIMSHLYFKPYEQTKSLQYRITLIRLNLREHLLLLPCSHIIFDGTSSMILESQLLEEYEDPQLEHTTEEVHYMDYVKHIRQGPQGISDQQIVEQYKLQSFVESTSQIYKLTREFKYGQMTTYQWDIALPSISMQNDSVNLWDISLQMAFQFFGVYFRKSEIPLWLTQYGRQYGDRNYFESVGEYIDHIPVLLHKEEMLSYHAVIKKQLSVAANHHLNFFNLIFNEEMEPMYPQASSMLKKGLGQLPIVFNYLGEMQEASKMLSTLNRSTTLVDGEEVIFFEAAHTGAVLQIFLRLPYEEKHEDIYRILQAANDKIISDLAIRQ
ncbi:amino acid adenylation domain-containing protein [Paenibacillus sp. 8b26]